MGENENSHCEFIKEITKELNDFRNKKTQQYNFDFEKFLPLTGNYTWELIPKPSNTSQGGKDTQGINLSDLPNF